MNKRRLAAIFVLLCIIVISAAAVLTQYYETLTRDIANRFLRPYHTQIDQVSFSLSSPHHWHIEQISLTVNGTKIHANGIDIVRKAASPWFSLTTEMIDYLAVQSLTVDLSASLLNNKTNQIDQQGPSAALDVSQLPQVVLGNISLTLPDAQRSTVDLDYLTFDEQANLRLAANYNQQLLARIDVSLAPKRWQLDSTIDLQSLQKLTTTLGKIAGAEQPQSRLHSLHQFSQLPLVLNGSLHSQATLSLNNAQLTSRHQITPFEWLWQGDYSAELRAFNASQPRQPGLDFTINGAVNQLILTLDASHYALQLPLASVEQLALDNFTPHLQSLIAQWSTKPTQIAPPHSAVNHGVTPSTNLTEPTATLTLDSTPIAIDLANLLLAPVTLNANLSLPQLHSQLQMSNEQPIPLRADLAASNQPLPLDWQLSLHTGPFALASAPSQTQTHHLQHNSADKRTYDNEKEKEKEKDKDKDNHSVVWFDAKRLAFNASGSTELQRSQLDLSNTNQNTQPSSDTQSAWQWHADIQPNWQFRLLKPRLSKQSSALVTKQSPVTNQKPQSVASKHQKSPSETSVQRVTLANAAFSNLTPFYSADNISLTSERVNLDGQTLNKTLNADVQVPVLNVVGTSFDIGQLSDNLAQSAPSVSLLRSEQSQLNVHQLKWQSDPQAWSLSVNKPQLTTKMIHFSHDTADIRSQQISLASQGIEIVQQAGTALGSQTQLAAPATPASTQSTSQQISVWPLSTQLTNTEVFVAQQHQHYQAVIDTIHIDSSTTNTSQAPHDETSIKINLTDFARSQISQLLNYQLDGVSLTKTDTQAKRNASQTLIDLSQVHLSQHLDFKPANLNPHQNANENSAVVQEHTLAINTHEQWQLGLLALTSQHEASFGRDITVTGQLQQQGDIAQLLALAPSDALQQWQVALAGSSDISSDYQLIKSPQQLTLNADINARFSALNGGYRNLPFEDGLLTVNCHSNLSSHKTIQARVTCPAIDFNVAAFNPGTVISNLNINADIDADLSPLMAQDSKIQPPSASNVTPSKIGPATLNLTASGELLGGELLIPSFNLNTNADSHAYIVLQGLQLQQLLDIQPVTGLYADGVFDGVLPMDVVNRQLTISGGQLAARAPGGLIMLDGNPAIEQMRLTQPYLDFVFSTLEHLQYSELASSFDMAAGGDAVMAVSVKGKAADVTRPIHLNYHHQENVLQLLKSLQIGDKLQNQIEQSMQQ